MFCTGLFANPDVSNCKHEVTWERSRAEGGGGGNAGRATAGSACVDWKGTDCCQNGVCVNT